MQSQIEYLRLGIIEPRNRGLREAMSMAIPETTLELIDRFNRNRDAYLSGAYNEFQLRKEFLDPFFEALGWDMQNKLGYAEAYKDVIHEDAIKVGGFTKAPDYCFRIGGTRKFFVEAKKPSVNLKDDTSPAFQLRRYAWSAKLPLSVLSDFEEFAVYDCRVKPVKTDKASNARILYVTYDQYPGRWDDIAAVFARDAILKGSFDKYVETTKGKKGTAEVDAAFLQEIESWRDSLARNLALRNPGLSQRELNYAVQTIIDRIIFLRICEDRGIEDYGRLMALQNSGNTYSSLFELFERADERYNSGLFHFRDEKGRDEPADVLTPGLTIDDKPLKEIIKNLYYPDSAYEFAVLPADILGQVYEQFLGKVIRLTAGHHAVVEDKPEVKKAGGVYYTPTYIVDYIIKNTVGKLLDGKTPRQVAKLRMLDPACGSGSFLIAAYQYLLDWHRDWYLEDGVEKHIKVLYQGPGGEWRLTTNERKRILLSNIHGVDIDPQAVEVTKLSLLLKVLEGESDDTISKQLKLFHERALPDLSNNIKCGNSLVGPDFHDSQQMTLLDDQELYRINAFDWNVEFSNIMNSGGFNVVIGNPPYLRIQGLQEYYGDQIEYYIRSYSSATKRFDLYQLFIEKGFSLMSPGGQLGFICPHKFTHADMGSGLRQFLIDNTAISSIVSFGENLVFKDATIYTCILIITKVSKPEFSYAELNANSGIDASRALDRIDEQRPSSIRYLDLSSRPWVLASSSNMGLISKLQKQTASLGETFESVFQGIVTGADKIYFLKRQGDMNKGLVEVFSERQNASISVESEILKPILKGEDVSRYREPHIQYFCIYPYRLVGGKTTILEEHEFSSTFPQAYSYLAQYRDELHALRIKFKTNPNYWYSCHRARSIAAFEADRLITPEISYGCNMTMATKGIYHNTTVYSLVPKTSCSEDIHYWLGLLNTKLTWWFLVNTGTVLRGGYYRFKTNYLKPLPVKTIDFSDATEKELHDKVVKHVMRMIELQARLTVTKTPESNTAINREVGITDRRINALVYDLYKLTEDERRLIEGHQRLRLNS